MTDLLYNRPRVSGSTRGVAEELAGSVSGTAGRDGEVIERVGTVFGRCGSIALAGSSALTRTGGPETANR